MMRQNRRLKPETEPAFPQAIRYSYDPEGAETRFMHRHVFSQWRTATDVFGVSIMLLFLWFIVKIAIREYGPFFAKLHPAFVNIAPLVFWAGIVLGLAAAYFCGLLVERLHETLTDASKERTIYGRGPINVVLDQAGVHTRTSYMTQSISWSAVRAVIPNAQGIGLRLDNTNFIPVVEAELPEGTTSDDVMASIDVWRGTPI